MALERRTRWVIAALASALALTAVYRAWPRTTAQAGSPASNVRGPQDPQAAAGAIEAPDVRLEALGGERPGPIDAERNLFRFRPAPPPQREELPPRAVQEPPPRPAPPPSSSVPPISLKFVGFLETENGEKIASLNDGRGVVIGKEGQTLLGRYKIWRIGEESIDLSYVDGTGRTTIRLTGQ